MEEICCGIFHRLKYSLVWLLYLIFPVFHQLAAASESLLTAGSEIM
jgi:hypothetical protein